MWGHRTVGVCPAAWTSAPLPQAGARIRSHSKLHRRGSCRAGTAPWLARSVHTPTVRRPSHVHVHASVPALSFPRRRESTSAKSSRKDLTLIRPTWIPAFAGMTAEGRVRSPGKCSAPRVFFPDAASLIRAMAYQAAEATPRTPRRAPHGAGIVRSAQGCARAASQPWMADRAAGQSPLRAATPPRSDLLRPKTRSHCIPLSRG
jgi:hypothetical protein